VIVKYRIMVELKEFIRVTSIYDGMPALIRSACIESVEDNAEQRNGDMIKLPCRTIYYSGHSLDVIEGFEEIVDMIYRAEM